MRLQWLQEIKKEDCNEIGQKKNSVGNKKKKVPQMQEWPVDRIVLLMEKNKEMIVVSVKEKNYIVFHS